MTIKNSQIRAKARHLLDDNILGKDWLKSVVLNIMMVIIVGVPAGILIGISNQLFIPFLLEHFGGYAPVLTYVIPILVQLIEFLALNIFIGPLSVGLASVHIDLVRGEGSLKIRRFFDGFKNFVDNFQIGFMYMLHIALWTLLFIIPGIYVSYSYALAFHVKKDNPDYRWQQCFDESERLMEGNRWKLFKLHVSFIGWVILGSVALCGLGSLWVTPYQEVSVAVFYEEAKKSRDLNAVSTDPSNKTGTDPVVVDLAKKGIFNK
jgi:uncharacterized membrane protein